MKKPIPGLSPMQSQQSRDLKDHVVDVAQQVAGDDDAARRRFLTFPRNRLKVILDGVSAPQKVKQTAILRKQQNDICPRCGLPLPDDPDAVESIGLTEMWVMMI